MASSGFAWPWSSPDRELGGDDITVTITIQWGLTKLAVTTADTAPRMWLHGVALSATVQSRTEIGEIEDTHLCGIGEPIRMSPSGRFEDAWRPARFDLADGSLHRPTFRALISASTRRRDPVKLHPGSRSSTTSPGSTGATSSSRAAPCGGRPTNRRRGISSR